MTFMQLKSNLYTKMMLTITALVLLGMIALPTNAEAAVTFDPSVDYLDVNSAIVIEFDRPIQLVSSADVDLFEAGSITAIGTNKSATNNKLTITPSSTLKKDTDYELRFVGHAVLGTDNSQVLPITSPGNLVYRISTDSLTFEQLMSKTREINYLINDYTPRRILVKAPIRYIAQLDVIHKRQEAVQGSTTESVTNLDLTINNSNVVKRIKITPMRNGKALQTPREFDNLNLSGAKVFDVGFTKLPDTSAFDIEVILYDIDDNQLDSRIVKIPLESKNITTVKQKDTFKTAGRNYTLYDLMNKPNDLQQLLNENRMSEITVQVKQQ
ncbi:MAG TPA: Ig-like domain-containing protein [Bacilli bacterium]|nr:Ig-like domain-containing protein [Bacilli bacterium]